jgi:hypothetical protein
MSVDKADVTAFFERSALKLNVSPQRLAVLVNGFETMAMRDWDSVSEVEGIEMADIEEFRARLFEYLAKAKNH